MIMRVLLVMAAVYIGAGANAVTYPSTDTPLPIPGTVTAGESVISVPDSVTITDVNVFVDITTPDTSGLVIMLTSPLGTAILLHDASGGVHDTLRFVYDDEFGSNTLTPGELALFQGENSQGNWTLSVLDNFDNEVSILHAWSLIINSTPTGTGISGNITHIGDDAVNRRITVYDAFTSPLEMIIEASAEPDGSYGVEVPAGVYWVSAMAASSSCDPNDFFEDSRIVFVTEGQIAIENFEFAFKGCGGGTLTPPTVVGTVRDAETDDIITGASVSLDSATATPTNNGVYNFTLPPGGATVQATATGYEDGIATSVSGGVGGAPEIKDLFLTPLKGSLTLNINPAEVVTAGAKWQVDGGALQNSGDTVTGLSLGNHTVSFTNVTGWNTPANQVAAITANNETTINATYVKKTGSLKVDISPAGAVTAGAKWSVDGGALQNSGDTVTGLAIGDHAVSFSSVTDWDTPADQIVTIEENTLTTRSGTYVQHTGSLKVDITPAGAVTDGAKWRVDGGALQNSGATVSGLTVGNHTVSFNTVAGWATPADQIVAIVKDTLTTANGVYSDQSGSLTVTITPAGAVAAGAKWSVDGGALHDSGDTVTGLSIGDHTVSFSAVTGWDTPANQTATIFDDTLTSLEGVYVEQTGSLTVNISPPEAVAAGAQWSIDGGKALHNSGDTVSGLTLGNHTISFTAAEGFNTPNDIVTIIAANQTTTENATYIPSESEPENINGDGGIDAVDIQLVINAALGIGIGGLDADVDGDTDTDAVDIQLVINAALAK
jgi:subtilisin-like proprotein convertase family protein